ncbi:WXG100 family type VII secretion target [Blastococcus sp. Marseille-P5729]|uniref:WXG100 family type VII secretion target n=1 Tax=Blastococcus sp. Marseille-P5729 TaxID=2086582 RepID=UPI000D0EEFDB|nr:WXG100 family type VII secretion target [Blastococcus sp. Marseille-P5729]
MSQIKATGDQINAFAQQAKAAGDDIYAQYEALVQALSPDASGFKGKHAAALESTRLIVREQAGKVRDSLSMLGDQLIKVSAGYEGSDAESATKIQSADSDFMGVASGLRL